MDGIYNLQCTFIFVIIFDAHSYMYLEWSWSTLADKQTHSLIEMFLLFNDLFVLFFYLSNIYLQQLKLNGDKKARTIGVV